MANKITKNIDSFFKSIKNEIIQDIPNELVACEICRKPECSNETWLDCENRINLKKKIEQQDNINS